MKTRTKQVVGTAGVALAIYMAFGLVLGLVGHLCCHSFKAMVIWYAAIPFVSFCAFMGYAVAWTLFKVYEELGEGE